MPQVGEQIIYLGIDPGASGGLVAISGGQVEAVKMPKTPQEIWNWISSYSEPFGNRSFAIIERVGGYVGGEGQPGSSMFNFGAGYGGLVMALTAARIPYEEVVPRTWQKELGIEPKRKGESTSQWKNRLRERARELMPHIEMTLAVADACLIAFYCQKVRRVLPIIFPKKKTVVL